MNKNQTRDTKTQEFWRSKLTPEEFNVLREKGTEYPFTGKYVNHSEEGIYKCAACGTELFASKDKYQSYSGWPSFKDVVDAGKVELKPDNSHGMIRTEVVCKKCGGHLGHVFDEPNNDTGVTYCINSVALDFEKGNGEQGPGRELV